MEMLRKSRGTIFRVVVSLDCNTIGLKDGPQLSKEHFRMCLWGFPEMNGMKDSLRGKPTLIGGGTIQ